MLSNPGSKGQSKNLFRSIFRSTSICRFVNISASVHVDSEVHGADLHFVRESGFSCNPAPGRRGHLGAEEGVGKTGS